MKQLIHIAVLTVCLGNASGQKKSYVDSLRSFQKKYVSSHEVVKGKDRKAISFYPVNSSFEVVCNFEKSNDTSIIAMKTSGTSIPVKDFKRYGSIYFKIHDSLLKLTVYKSSGIVPAEYKDFLFIPFTDLTSGAESYGGGRYIDVLTTDIKNNKLQLDFNKAYNPYCAYTTGFNCPIPPGENNLAIAVMAGEKAFAKH